MSFFVSSGSIRSTQLRNDFVPQLGLASGAATSGTLANGAVTSGSIASGSLCHFHLTPPADVDIFTFYGDGSDGSVHFDGTTTVLGHVPSGNTYTLIRNIWAKDIQLDFGVIIDTICYRLSSRGTLTWNGTIRNKGADGSSTSGFGGSGGLGVAGLGANSGGFYIGGGAGGNAGLGAATTRSGSTPLSTRVYGGGSGGRGGSVSSGPATGGLPIQTLSGGIVLSQDSSSLFTVPWNLLGLFATSGSFIAGGTGGGGGATQSNASGQGHGGGGGGGGGYLVVAAQRITGTSGTMDVTAGNGGNSISGAQDCGGGGGGGGVGIIFTQGPNVPYVLMLCSGGNGGSGGRSGGAGGAGTNGSGYIILN